MWTHGDTIRALAGTIALTASLSGVAWSQQSPADEARLKKLDTGPGTIDVSKYPGEQQQAYKIFQAKCAGCHALARGVNTEMVLPGEWERYVKRMMFKPNSGISNDQGKALFRFMVYDASARKTDLLRTRLGALPPEERAAALERIKGINPTFGAQ